MFSWSGVINRKQLFNAVLFVILVFRDLKRHFSGFDYSSFYFVCMDLLVFCVWLSKVCMQGQNGSHFEPKPVPPPIPKKCDWEIEPAELDFSNAAMIGKVCVFF